MRSVTATLLKVILLHGCFLHFLKCTNDTKSRLVSHILDGLCQRNKRNNRYIDMSILSKKYEIVLVLVFQIDP